MWSADIDGGTRADWNSAEIVCVNNGGHLASVTSEAIMGYLVDRMKEKRVPNIWIGANDKDQEGVWRWTDNTPWGFTSWAHGEPNNFATNNHCLEVQCVDTIKCADFK